MTDDVISRELDAQLARFADRVRRAVARYGLADGDVDEIFQEVRIRLWRAKERGNIVDASASYVYRTAVSAAIDLIRRRRARREDPADVDRPGGEARLGAAPAANHMAEENELADSVEQEIPRHPVDRVLAVRMRVFAARAASRRLRDAFSKTLREPAPFMARRASAERGLQAANRGPGSPTTEPA